MGGMEKRFRQAFKQERDVEAGGNGSVAFLIVAFH